MDELRQQVLGLAPLITALRRDLHRHPETGWLEYRTTAMVAQHLQALGYTVRLGSEAVNAAARLDPPCPLECARARQRAVSLGADPRLVTRMGDGLTGLWADLVGPGPDADPNPEGSSPEAAPPGPVVALRFDMDANDVLECPELEHRPSREGFASDQQGVMHACGHDGHTAIGMGVAAVLTTLRHTLRGTVRLIFQPAEEQGQGALAMLKAGVMEGVDTLLGMHLGMQAAEGEVICATTHFLATTTFELSFNGKTAHAGMAPQEGRNALLAATTAVQNMQAIARHGDGATRINVGQLSVEGAPNIIPARAWLAGETRGVTSAIDAYMMEEVERMAHAAAHMWGCESRLRTVSSCPSGLSDMVLAGEVARVAERMGCFSAIIPSREFWASEDFTWLLNAVQAGGGQGIYMQMGAARAGGHHTERFDFSEGALERGVELMTRLAARALDRNGSSDLT